MEERTHHPLSPSNYPMWAVCPHYESSAPTKGSEDGVKKHEQLAKALDNLKSGLPLDAFDDDIQWAADQIFGLSNGDDIIIEGKVEVQNKNDYIEVGIYGYPDAWCYNPFEKELTVIDFKSGSESDMDYMPQLEGYATIIAQNLKAKGTDVDGINLVVLYGADRRKRITKFGKSAIPPTTLVYARVRDYITRRRDAVAGQEPAKIGAQCRYCSRRLECRAFADCVDAITNTRLSGMSPASLYATLSAVKAACEAEMESLKTLARDNGGFLDDGTVRYELRKNKHGSVQSVSIGKMARDIAERFGLPEAALYCLLVDSATISKAKCVGAASKIGKDSGRKVVKKEAEEIYDKHCTFGEPAERFVKVEKERK